MKLFFPVKQSGDALWAFTVSAVLQLVSLLQFHLMMELLPSSGLFAWQFHFIIALSLAVSTLCFLFPVLRGSGLIVKLILLFLISYPLGSYLWLSLVFMISLLVEEGLYFSSPGNLVYMAVIIIFSLAFQKPRNAFYARLPGPELHDRLLYITLALVVFVLITLYSRGKNRLKDEEHLTSHLDNALNSISKANLDFQTYSNSLQLDTLKRERKRVSREIHDTVGYSLTNIRIMLEAASLMIDDDPGQAAGLIDRSMKEAGICLEETRSAMRLLRSKELHRPRGSQSLL